MSNQFSASSEVTSDDKLWGLLSYIIPIFAIIVLVSEEKKNRPFLKYHAIQALAITVVLTVVIGTITIGCGSVLGVIYSIYLGIKAYQGEYVTIPVITNFCKKQGWIV